MAHKILIVNGPNLNRLGKRQPEIYGATTLADVEAMCRDRAETAGLAADCHQSNHEGEIIDVIHAACDGAADGIVINPGAFTHTSVAILDALNGFDGPVIEVHISNIHKREAFRHHSYVSGRADAVIAGCGVQGYVMAVDRMAVLLGAGDG
nr:type II 3-dehydroquinate dehydratase [Paracoccus albicereus]